ncbi:hypothetical protein [Actinoplanes sp. NBRC 103695]|uniref:hypothetical protein n=1 Tax=Actinoplanes sp. NBRC 103695 TaxID=3032202 RepID=UPI0024A35B5A|nr:hypothetical protein [Actinoplanes sp. NBRC 103695]GLY99391.1 hypothetical protein Acsp02_66440 [Actinoplanes sp. NBRC 103695]
MRRTEYARGVRIVAGVSVPLVLVTAAVLLAGCTSDHEGSGGDYTPTVEQSTAERQTREHADKVVAAVGVTGYAGTGQVDRLTCPGQISDYPDDELYRIRGAYQLPIPAEKQQAAYARLTERWAADGLMAREGGAGDPWVGEADLKVDTMDGFEISLTGGTTVQLLVVSKCLHDG